MKKIVHVILSIVLAFIAYLVFNLIVNLGEPLLSYIIIGKLHLPALRFLPYAVTGFCYIVAINVIGFIPILLKQQKAFYIALGLLLVILNLMLLISPVDDYIGYPIFNILYGFLLLVNINKLD